MELAHPGDQGLRRLRVGVDAERRILFGQALQRERQLVLVGLRLRLDLDLDDRLREGHRLEDDAVVGVGQRVAGVGVLEPDRCRDVARVDLVDLLAMVGVHLEDPADPLLLALARVEDVRAGLERARVDPEEGELADERVGRDLEGQRAERLAVRRRADDVGAGPRVEPDHRRDVERRRQVVDDRVEHLLDALVAQRRAGQDRDDPGGQRAQAQAALDLGDRQLLALEVLVGELVVHLGDGLDQRVAVRLRLGSQLVRDLDLVDLVAQVVAVVDGLHLDQVDHALRTCPRGRSGSGSARPWRPGGP